MGFASWAQTKNHMGLSKNLINFTSKFNMGQAQNITNLVYTENLKIIFL